MRCNGRPGVFLCRCDAFREGAVSRIRPSAQSGSAMRQRVPTGFRRGFFWAEKRHPPRRFFSPGKIPTKCRKPNEIKEFPVVFMLKTWYNMG